MENELYIIAVDGPAGAGKSTVCDDIAKALGILHLDTGATFRTVALALIRQGVDTRDIPAVEAALPSVNVEIDFADGKQIMYLNGENVTDLIRTNEVSAGASAVATIPAVRVKMLELQRKTAEKISMIVDGRDICTCAFPDAKYKFYVTADVAERARRRAAQLAEKGIICDLAELEKEIAARDYNDMHREMAPLRQAPDATLVYTTSMTQQEVVEHILELVR